MKMNFKHLLTLFLLVGLLTSCVSSKKYKALQAEYESAQMAHKKRLEMLKSELSETQKEVINLKGEASKLRTEAMNAKKDAEAALQMQKLREKEIASIKMQIKKAFSGLDDPNLHFTTNNGRLILSLTDNVLFRKGRADLSRSGKDVISRLSEVFKQHPDMRILIMGHTDSDKVRRTRYLYKDNWDLSVARAANVVRALLSNGVSPNQLTAAGRADLDKIGIQVEGKDEDALERRVDFVLDPDAEALYKIYKKVKYQ